jgi:hypothetical protein
MPCYRQKNQVEVSLTPLLGKIPPWFRQAKPGVGFRFCIHRMIRVQTGILVKKTCRRVFTLIMGVVGNFLRFAYQKFLPKELLAQPNLSERKL